MNDWMISREMKRAMFEDTADIIAFRSFEAATCCTISEQRRPYRLLFVCTGNACRSAMAEGFARYYGHGQIEVFSAGVAPGVLDPKAVRVMAEKHINIASHVPKSVSTVALDEMDLVVTLCDYAQQYCPSGPPAKHRLHWSIHDPSSLWGPDWFVLHAYRNVRDELGSRIRDLVTAVHPTH